jgi:hypothetical protein
MYLIGCIALYLVSLIQTPMSAVDSCLVQTAFWDPDSLEQVEAKFLKWRVDD